MSSRHNQKRDDLDLYIGWCLKNYDVYRPMPVDAKARLIQAAKIKVHKAQPRELNLYSLLRYVGRAIFLILLVFEENLVSAPLPHSIEYNYSHSNARQEALNVALHSYMHSFPPGVGYSCLVS